MVKRFAAKNLVLTSYKMNIMKFITKNSSHSTLHIAYKEKYIKEKVSTKFLGLQTDNHIKRKNHIKETISKWSMLCYQVNGPFQ